VIWLSLALAGAAAALTARLFAEQLGTGWLEAPRSTPIQHIHRPRRETGLVAALTVDTSSHGS
jgi:hypothetical protein